MLICSVSVSAIRLPKFYTWVLWCPLRWWGPWDAVKSCARSQCKWTIKCIFLILGDKFTVHLCFHYKLSCLGNMLKLGISLKTCLTQRRINPPELWVPAGAPLTWMSTLYRTKRFFSCRKITTISSSAAFWCHLRPDVHDDGYLDPVFSTLKMKNYPFLIIPSPRKCESSSRIS